jgi:putative membrane protein
MYRLLKKRQLSIRGSAAILWATAALVGTPAAAWAHGEPPAGSGSAWLEWNWDPAVLLLLAATTLLYVRGVRRLWRKAGSGRGIGSWRAAAFIGGMITLFVALVSPIDRLGGALFAMHMVQHMLLIFVAAPLLVLGLPQLGWLWALPVGWRRSLAHGWQRAPGLRQGWHWLVHPAPAWILHVTALWVWHIPGLYEAALAVEWIHVLEHITFTGTAILFWWALFDARTRRRMGDGVALFYLFAAMIQCTILGALITFAPVSWYPMHGVETTSVWGLTPLQDQQLAGLIMWIPSGPLYLTVFLLVMVRWLHSSEEEAQRRGPVSWSHLGQAQPARERE